MCSTVAFSRDGAYHFALERRHSFIEPEKPSVMKNAQHKEAWEKEGE